MSVQIQKGKVDGLVFHRCPKTKGCWWNMFWATLRKCWLKGGRKTSWFFTGACRGLGSVISCCTVVLLVVLLLLKYYHGGWEEWFSVGPSATEREPPSTNQSKGQRVDHDHHQSPELEKAPHHNISNVIQILSSGTTCQLKQLFSKSEAAMLSTRNIPVSKALAEPMDCFGCDDSDNVTKWGNLPATTMRTESNSGVGDKVIVGASGKEESSESSHVLFRCKKKVAFKSTKGQRQ